MLDQVLLLLGGEGARHIGLYKSGRNAINSNIATADFARKRLTEAEYSSFGRRIVRLP